MRVLLLSTTTGYQLRSFNDAAERLGVELTFATNRCHTLDDPWRDRAIPVRFHEERASLNAIRAAARERPFSGVLVVGDRPTVLAARAARMLGLPGNPPDGAAASANKRLTRERFAAARVNAPWFFTVSALTEAEDLLREPRLRFPCVVKPLGLSGSRGVIRANTSGELEAAWHRVRALLGRRDIRAQRAGLEDEILIEGYIDGPEFVVEGVLTAGVLKVFTIFDKPDPLEGPYFEETIYLTPSTLREDEQTAMVDEAGRAIQALGLRHGAVHVECRLGPDGPVVLEIAARPIGGLCSKALRFSDRSSLEDVLLRHALGESVDGVTREADASAVMMIPIPRRGLLRRVDGQDEARAVPNITDLRITAKPDQLLEPLPEAGSYLGFIFARGETAFEVDRSLREAHRRLDFVIDPAIDVRT